MMSISTDRTVTLYNALTSREQKHSTALMFRVVQDTCRGEPREAKVLARLLLFYFCKRSCRSMFVTGGTLRALKNGGCHDALMHAAGRVQQLQPTIMELPDNGYITQTLMPA